MPARVAPQVVDATFTLVTGSMVIESVVPFVRVNVGWSDAPVVVPGVAL